MQLGTPEHKQQTTQKKYVFATFAVIFLCAVAVTFFVCRNSYDVERDSIIAHTKDRLNKAALEAAKVVTEWNNGLKSQTERISSSELYRLFVKEARTLSVEQLRMLSEGSTPVVDGSDLALVAEQMGIMRNVLREYNKYSGFDRCSLISAGGRVLLATDAPVPLNATQMQVFKSVMEKGSPGMTPVYMNNGQMVVDYIDPFHRGIETRGEEGPVGAILVTTPVHAQVTRLLHLEGKDADGIRLYFLQKNQDAWEEISPYGLRSVTEQVRSFISADKKWVLPFEPHASLSGGQAYSCGVQVGESGWWVVAEVLQADVVAQLNTAADVFLVRGGLACLSFLLLLPLLWWISVGRGQHATALRFRELYHTMQRQKQFLDSVNISLDVGLFMANEVGKIQLCNRAFADLVRRSEEDLQGMEVTALFEGLSQKRLDAGINQVLRQGKQVTFEIDRRYTDAIFLYRAALFPFLDKGSDAVAGVVGTVQDITDFRRRSILQRRQQTHTMNAFMRAIESVDPYLAGHSHTMRAFSGPVCKQLGLTHKDARTVVMAAELSQVGKMSIPPQILHKEGSLSSEELAEIRRAPENAYKLLHNISFDLPVADAIYCMQERMDGTGYPRGLKGSDIPIHARIIGVLNAFCAMTSPRFYRQGMSARDAFIAMQADSAFDQTVVQALYRVLRTEEGAEILKQRRNVTDGADD